ncbi:Spy/CpxP family protein refolding chaperone [Pseudomonas sp. S5(2021)]|nr:conserved hypothetical protein [Acidovorax sp. JS42]MBZ5757607.1 Spy/CpxP family protein refolding chaperone [Pseudomonas sp. S5(2021)]RTV19924.1 periplasmic heavy metal sensor [Pseudomonas aeruginosa]
MSLKAQHTPTSTGARGWSTPHSCDERRRIMKKTLSALLLVTALGAGAASAHGQMMGQSGPGMMGQGMGMMQSGMMGVDAGMMMGGPGMMGNCPMMGGGMMGMMQPGMMSPGMMGQGMMGGYGPMAPFANLDEQQRQQLAEIHTQLQEQQQPLMQQMYTRMQELQSLMAQPDAKPKAVGDKYAQVFELRQQMAQNMAEAQQQMRQLFNKQD